MRAPGLILFNLTVAAGAVGLYCLLFPSGGADPQALAPPANELAADAGAPDPALADGIGLQLMKARAAIQAGGSDDDLRALFSRAGIELDAAAESRVFSVYREHFEALRENLEIAHAAALGNTTNARRGAIRARSVALHTDMAQALRAHLSQAQVLALLEACPRLVPPPPGPTDDTPRSRPGGSSVPWPAPKR